MFADGIGFRILGDGRKNVGNCHLQFWDNEFQIKAWKENAEYHVVQSKGKAMWYKSYSVEITREPLIKSHNALAFRQVCW